MSDIDSSFSMESEGRCSSFSMTSDCSTRSMDIKVNPMMEEDITQVSTQPFDSFEDMDESDGASPEKLKSIWGFLLPIGHLKEMIPTDLHDSSYTIGRAPSCKIMIDRKKLPADRLTLISKEHFTISFNGNSAMLTDKSFNGTFVNEEKVGKNKQIILGHNDIISMANHSFKAFVYIDAKLSMSEAYPDELKRKYVVSKHLGKGASGEVKLVFLRESGKQFAVKIIQKNRLSQSSQSPLQNQKYLLNEIKILKELKHPCIINFEEIIDTPEALYLVLEYAEGGELFDLVASSGRLKEPIAKKYFYQLALAIKFMHDNKVVHRDLKPENILLSAPNAHQVSVLKVTDFGMSKILDHSTMNTFCGTPTYVAPEIFAGLGKTTYDSKVDCWSLGVILFVCLGGYPPFSQQNSTVPLREQIIRGLVVFHPKVWTGVSTQAVNLIKKLLIVDPKKRLSSTEILQHPWLKDDDVKEEMDLLLYNKRLLGSPDENIVPRKMLRSSLSPQKR